MNCKCGNISERNGKCASCNREQRKAERESLKPPKTKRPIDKVGKKNTFECSDGERVTQAEINKRLTESHEMIFWRTDTGEQSPRYCSGCGKKTGSTAHIVPKARCKVLKKTELIWSLENQFPACFDCNAIAENVSSPAITKLRNYPQIKAFLELHDYERFTKLPDYSIANEPHIL